MLTACNSSRTTLRMLFSSLSVCSVARMACTRNSLRLADGTCCSNAHARRCCGSLRFGRKTYCGRFMPHFYGATQRSTRARIRLRSPYRPAGKSSYKGRLWGLGGGSPPMPAAQQHGGDGVQIEAGFHRGRQQMLCVLATLPVHNVAHRIADRAGLTCQHIFDLGIRERQPGFRRTCSRISSTQRIMPNSRLWAVSATGWRCRCA